MTIDPGVRIATLANGEAVPLARAAAVYSRLDSYLRHSDAEWDIPYFLREVCLGRSIEPEQSRVLAREGLLAPDGRPDPDVRAVVLAAVRGEGRLLHLSSPFTDADDRAVAEFLNARDHIASLLPEAEARSLLADPLPDLLRQSLGDRTPSITDAPAQVREIFRRMGRHGRVSPPPEGPATDGPSRS